MGHIQIEDGWADYNKGLDTVISLRGSLSEDSHVVGATQPWMQRGSGELIFMLQWAQLIGKHSSSLIAEPPRCYALYVEKVTAPNVTRAPTISRPNGSRQRYENWCFNSWRYYGERALAAPGSFVPADLGVPSCTEGAVTLVVQSEEDKDKPARFGMSWL